MKSKVIFKQKDASFEQQLPCGLFKVYPTSAQIVKIFRTKPKDLAFQLVDGIVYNANVLTNGVNHGGYSRTLWVDDSLVSICLTIDSVLIRDSYIWDMTGNLIVEPRQSVLAQFTDKELTEFARTGLLIKMK